jgi:hypothetical protein
VVNQQPSAISFVPLIMLALAMVMMVSLNMNFREFHSDSVVFKEQLIQCTAMF